MRVGPSLIIAWPCNWLTAVLFVRLDWCDVTPTDEDDYLKVVDVVADVDVEESVGESLAIASSMATVWQQHFHCLATDQNHFLVYSFVF